MTDNNEPTCPDELGTHVSNAGGVRNAPGRAALLDSCVLQLFTKQASRWADPVPGNEDVDAFRAAMREHDIRAAAAHDSYLINLASPDTVLRARSMQSFHAEVQRCSALGIPFIVSHPGNATDNDFASGIVRNAEGLQEALEASHDVAILLETTAGTGRSLGATFEQLATILDHVPGPLQPRLGICVDTCHVWAAGYDIATEYDDVIARLDDVIGLRRVRMFHLNDSAGVLGCRRDRHAHIGDGAIGDAAFRSLLNDERFRDVPKVIETPKDDDVLAADRRNLARLRGYRT